jgi:hypothetical protein
MSEAETQLREKLVKVLALSEALRPGYTASLGLGRRITSPSPLLRIIYETVNGTPRTIEDQKFMDFIPGFFLIHADERAKAESVIADHAGCDELCRAYSYVLPLLSNYSSDYLCVAGNANGDSILSIDHEELEVSVRHASSCQFLETIIQFYQRQVYFLDGNGCLDYDFDRAQEVGAELNPGVEYWQ